MEYKVLYRKYRPNCFKDIVGQESTKTMLQNAVKNNKISHAYIFTGPRGTGKTSTAKIFAKSINCENPHDGEPCGKCSSCINFYNSADIIEIDAASNNGVDEIRELINNVKIAPTDSKYKIYIIDEVHMLTSNAFNALLLTLEEPPAHVIFIMATTNIESVPITILSRCQRFDFKKFTIQELQEQITSICQKENIEITEEASLEIAYISEGGMRDALSLLDQLSSSTKKITIDEVLVNYGSISTIFIKDLYQNILKNEVMEVINKFEKLKNESSDYKIFIKKLIQEALHDAIKLKTSYMSERLSYEQIKKFIFELNDCLNRTNININPYSLIELICLNYLDNESSTLEPLKNESNKMILADNSSTEAVKKEKEDIVEQPKCQVQEEVSLNEITEDDSLKELKRIRVNNCFVGAKKEVLIELKEQWSNLSSSPIPDDILGLLVDTEMVAASNTNVILVNSLASAVLLINHQITDITDYLCEFFGLELKFIALTTEEWQQEKKCYIENLKNGKKYQYIEESSTPVFESNEDLSEFEKVAQDIFNHDKIEIV